jgi:hypothetical protein
MDGGNVDTWHNRMYESCVLIVEKLFNVYPVFNNPNLVTIIMQFFKKSNIVDYMRKYGVYNTLKTTM